MGDLYEFWEQQFNGITGDYGDRISATDTPRMMHYADMDSIESIRKVCVVGVGHGGECAFFQHMEKEVYGLDISDTALRKVSDICIEVFSTENYKNIPTNFFDLIVEFNVSGHIDDDAIQEQLIYLIPTLTTTGIFVFQTNEMSLAEDYAADHAAVETNDYKSKVGSHVRSYDYLEHMVKKAGGKIVKRCIPYSDVYGIRCYSVHIMREQ